MMLNALHSASAAQQGLRSKVRRKILIAQSHRGMPRVCHEQLEEPIFETITYHLQLLRYYHMKMIQYCEGVDRVETMKHVIDSSAIEDDLLSHAASLYRARMTEITMGTQTIASDDRSAMNLAPAFSSDVASPDHPADRCEQMQQAE